MDWVKIGNYIFEIYLIPLIGVLTVYLVQIIRAKTKSIKSSTNNELLGKYLDLLTETITSCVIATNQTYVEELKGKNIFDADAQKTAFKMTYDSVMAILNDEAKVYLENIFGDLEAYITKRIEMEVNQNKNATKEV